MERFPPSARCVGRWPAGYRTLTKVTLRLFDTGSRAVREFRPVTRGKASVYLCGATVQGAPHLGHLRSATCFDLGHWHDVLSTGNLDNAVTCLAQARAMLAVLGLDPLAPAWRAGHQDGRLREVVDALIGLALSQREAARARGDYASADSIRDTLEDTGVVVDDTPEGPRWELAR